MDIMRLRREDIPFLTKDGNQALVDEVTKELDNAEKMGCVVYVRYGPRFLQRMRVDEEFVNRPEVQAMIFDQEYWDRQTPMTDEEINYRRHIHSDEDYIDSEEE